MDTQQFIHLIADYGTGDPAFAEVMQKLRLLAPGVIVYPTSVPAFSTLATGFWTYQFGLVNPLPGMMIFSNTAPRRDTKEKREHNEGEKLLYAELKNGVRVVGVNAGHCFSFIKPDISKLYVVNVANKGSQFRSRDFFPDAVVGITGGDSAFIGEEFDSGEIPDVPTNKIVWIDGYGNMKTTTRKSQLSFAPGEPVLVSVNKVKRTAYYTDGTFSVREGQLAFAPGSSGGEDRFMEIFLRGLSAWNDFGRPNNETDFSVTPYR